MSTLSSGVENNIWPAQTKKPNIVMTLCTSGGYFHLQDALFTNVSCLYKTVSITFRQFVLTLLIGSIRLSDDFADSQNILLHGLYDYNQTGSIQI